MSPDAPPPPDPSELASLPPDPARRRAFSLLFVVLMVVAAGNTALQAVMPAIGRELGLGDTLVAAIFSLSALFWAGSAPFWAAASDRRGRKPLIVFGLAGYAVSMTAVALTVIAGLNGWIGVVGSFIFLFIARSIYGLTGSATNPASQAYVADRTGFDERTPALATLASAIGLGTVLGPAVAPFLTLEPIGLTGPIFGCALVAAAVLIFVQRGLPETAVEAASRPEVGASTPTAERRTGLLRDRRVRAFLIYAFVVVSVQAAQTQAVGFLIIDTLNLPPRQAQTFIGAAMMAGAAAGLLAQWGLIRIFHMTPKDLMRWGAGLACAGNLLTAFAPDYGAVVFAFALSTLGFGFARPGFTAGASLAVGPHEQGAVAGVMTAVVGAGFILSPVLAMALYEVWRPGPFLGIAAMAAGATAYAFLNGALSHAGERVQPKPESTTLLRG